MRLLTAALVLIVGLMPAGPAAAQEKFKAVTNFTVIADIARTWRATAIVESITKPNAEIIITSRRRATYCAPRTRNWSSGTG